MRPKMPVLLYCADRELLSATAFALRLQPYDVTAVNDRRNAAAIMMTSQLVYGILIHAKQGDFPGRLIHRSLEADLHVPLLLIDRAGDLAPVRYADMGSLWPQQLDGSYPRCPQCALRSEAWIENRRMKYLSVCSGIEAVTAAWESLGWQLAMFAEIDPFCCWLWVRAIAHRGLCTCRVRMTRPHAKKRSNARQPFATSLLCLPMARS